jgi:hypothetical protein
MTTGRSTNFEVPYRKLIVMTDAMRLIDAVVSPNAKG